MLILILALTPVLDTLLSLNGGPFSGEGDIPVWMATVSGDTLLISDGNRIFLFLVSDGGIEFLGKWVSPVAFDDMVSWHGKLYVLSGGEGKVYVLDGRGNVVDTVPIPYRYAGRSLYMFRCAEGVYLDMPGDSSYWILKDRPVPDPVLVGEMDGTFIIRRGEKVFHLPGGVVSASMAGEDVEGNAYLYVERALSSGVETGVGIVGADGLHLVWLGRFAMEGYIPGPMEVSDNGMLFLFLPASIGVRVLAWDLSGPVR